MKLTWKSKSKSKSKNNNNNKRSLSAISQYPNLPFERNDVVVVKTEAETTAEEPKTIANPDVALGFRTDDAKFADSFQEEGNKLAEDGRYREALGKWEAALNLMPERAVLHEQKAQLLLDFGDAWNALKAATRATELEPSWAEAWITLGRAQLNFGEPDSAISSFDTALVLKPDSKEARDDWHTALHLVNKRKQLHSSGLSDAKNRYAVGEATES